MRIVGEWRDDTWYGRVTVDGVEVVPLVSQAVHNHSPDGFAWGYPGSGPHQLALGLLLHVGVKPARAYQLHYKLAREFVSRLPDGRGFEIEFDVLGWAAAQPDGFAT